ncbi:TNF receptor-associated factor 2-like [Ptychodera flava]|uniref:TNF receptor-associated factor 2-like n=1 Tax=Ptychodera flava TaxID=63121 RepID=UPI003969E537
MPGYSKHLFRKPLEDKYICGKCTLVLRDPVQTYCGHRYCRACIEEILSNAGRHFCLRCGSDNKDDPDSEITVNKIFPDNAIKRELLLIKVKCLNTDCLWVGVFKDYEVHNQECIFEIIICIKAGCGKRFRRGHLTKHLESECDMRIVICDYCADAITWKELKIHHKECPKFPIKCDFCGKENILRELYHIHIDSVNGDCTKNIGPCKYSMIGCAQMVELEKMEVHLRDASIRHLDLLYDETIKTSEYAEALQRDMDVTEVTRQVAEHGIKIENVKRKVQEIEEATVIGKEYEPTLNRLSKTMEDQKNKTVVIETKISTYEGIVAVLNGQIERDSQSVKTVERQRRQDKELIESLERKIRAQDRIIALKDVALAEQDLRIKALEQTSYDGILVWKITDFTKKQQDALSGRTTSIYSPSFFTSRHGYKMCVRIYLNGDGMGRGNHVSLFFVVMKGPYDALLRWPFRQKVTFMLLDQNNREHIIDAFRPDPTSSSFKRPTSDMNIAFGYPLFMPICQIDSGQHAYVKDDVMFIKVIVDTSDLA